MKGSNFLRFDAPPLVNAPCPFAFKHYIVETDGVNVQLKEAELVPPCLASDYDIATNVLQGRSCSLPSRLVCDPVDVSQTVENFY